ncbi:Cytochrome b561 and DOMON domain-containing protein [Hibiscus syriacus]|uniref:Cytochrome b561 and DOMON domain-containing protein n=1 Tax=Hibiscus syriacus TaxID=106335 RepID=A0A6A3B7Y3_HIBSY|nr:Cytochrome b561 and DOMON domain-containing protein [Hibiscus syriacus]
MAPSAMATAFICSTFLALLIPPAVSLTCSGQKFTKNQVFSTCLDLPSLSSYLHFSYDSSNTTLSVAFVAAPSKPGGWVAWAINPKATGMAGSQALVAYKNSTSSLAVVRTFDISSYSSIVPKDLSFEIWDKTAESRSDGSLVIFAKIKIPADLASGGKIIQVWQIGPGVGADGMLAKHEFAAANLQSKGTLDLKNGHASGSFRGDTTIKNKNVTPSELLAEELVLSSAANPPRITYSGHRNIGIALFVLATVQIFALFLRPKKDHKYRFYWNIYHHSFGYAILVLGILNVFKGFNILRPDHKWKSAYMIVIIALGAISLALEAVTWAVVLKRRSGKFKKPYDGYNNGQGRQDEFF